MKIQTSEVDILLQIFNLFDCISFKVNDFKPCELFEIVNFLESFVMKIQDIVQRWSRIILFEIRPAEFFEKLFCNDTIIFGTGLEMHSSMLLKLTISFGIYLIYSLNCFKFLVTKYEIQILNESMK